MGEFEFNLDLSLIEKWLKQKERLYVQPAGKLPNLSKNPLSRTTFFVMTVGEKAEEDEQISGDEVVQDTKDIFAVIIGVRGSGSVQGNAAKRKVEQYREVVKKSLIGLIIDDFEPIQYMTGAMIEVNKETQNLMYQCQFATSRTVATEVKYYDI